MCPADSGCRIVALPRIVASRACVRTCVTRTRRVLFRGAVHLHNEKLWSSDLNMLEGSAKFRKKRCSAWRECSELRACFCACSFAILEVNIIFSLLPKFWINFSWYTNIWPWCRTPDPNTASVFGYSDNVPLLYLRDQSDAIASSQRPNPPYARISTSCEFHSIAFFAYQPQFYNYFYSPCENTCCLRILYITDNIQFDLLCGCSI